MNGEWHYSLSPLRIIFLFIRSRFGFALAISGFAFGETAVFRCGIATEGITVFRCSIATEGITVFRGSIATEGITIFWCGVATGGLPSFGASSLPGGLPSFEAGCLSVISRVGDFCVLIFYLCIYRYGSSLSVYSTLRRILAAVSPTTSSNYCIFY